MGVKQPNFNMKNTLKIFIYLLAAGFLFSCEEQETLIPTEQTVSVSDPVVQHILSIGAALEDIEEYNDFYVAEGDIMFDKDMVLPLNGSQTEQYATKSRVNAGNRNIKVYINHSSFALNPQDYNQGAVMTRRDVLIQALNGAMAAYNNLGTSIRFTAATSSSQANTITIQKPEQSLGGVEVHPWGRGDFPSGGRAGKTIDIFPVAANNNVSALTKVLVHELGHTIGLWHTDDRIIDYNKVERVPGTPGNIGDAASVMNSSWSDLNWVDFSNYDVVAINCLYGTSPNSQCNPEDDNPETCIAPGIPSSISVWTNQDYVYASVSRPNADGYEWQVSGGFIQSGNGTKQIKIAPYRSCFVRRTMTITLKTYNEISTGERCYSPFNASTTYKYQTDCGRLF